MKRLSDEAVDQPSIVWTGCLYYHLFRPSDDADDVPPVEDDPCWNLTLLEVDDERSAEEPD